MMVEVIIAFSLIFLYLSMIVSFVGVMLGTGKARTFCITAVLFFAVGIALIILQIPTWLGV